MRAIAAELGAYSERLEGSWSVETGPSGPILATMCPSKRHEGTVRRICKQLDAQPPDTHPGYICANGPEIEHPAIGRMRRPDAFVIPEAVLDEEGLAVNATQVLAAVVSHPPVFTGSSRMSRQRVTRSVAYGSSASSGATTRAWVIARSVRTGYPSADVSHAGPLPWTGPRPRSPDRRPG